MEKSKEVRQTACPTIGEWLQFFESTDNIIAITIFSGLSGSYNSAISARSIILESSPEKNIAVIDSKSTGSASDLIVLKSAELINKRYSFERVINILSAYSKEIYIVFSLSSFKNLVANGRMSKMSALIANTFNIWGVGIANDIGKISIIKKVKGSSKVVTTIINTLKEQNCNGGPIVLNHCENEELISLLKNQIRTIWEDATLYSHFM